MQKLPTLPTIHARITQMMDNPNSSAVDIGECVSRDQAIAAKLLEVVNSSYYGLSQRISSVTRAMTVVGFRGLKDLILTLAVLPILNRDNNKGGQAQRDFWIHSVACAAAARALARTLRYGEPEEMFTAGLLHDVGKLAEYWFMEREYTEARDQARQRALPLFVVELEEFGFTHAELGLLLARKWRFPDRLAEIIGAHHSPMRSQFQRDAALIHLADILACARMCGEINDQYAPPLDLQAWQKAGLQINQIEEVISLLEEEYERGRVFLAIVQGERT